MLPADLPDLDAPTALLGGLSPAQFMRDYWQKKPLLIRQAVPNVQPPLASRELFALATSDEVESRLIVQKGPAWSMQHGPLSKRAIPPVKQSAWTLLVQGLDMHVPQAHQLLEKFRFIPDARLDDLMMSFASDGGGVGPHYDSYDVFLLQVEGRRRWRIGAMQDNSLVPDMPLKILANFVPEQEWVLEPGDMLYLPPKWAHDGVADGPCMTCSIGFRAPDQAGLTAELLLRMSDHMETPSAQLYEDPTQAATASPASIPAQLLAFAKQGVERLLTDPHALATALGELMTEPKPSVFFETAEPLQAGQGVRLHPRSRMLFDERSVFMNGESWQATASQGEVLRQLAHAHCLSAWEVSQAPADVQELLTQWVEDGWLLALSSC